MITLARAESGDAAELRDIQAAAFAADVAQYGCGPEGHDALEWHLNLIEKQSLYFKILYQAKIVGGVVIFSRENGHYHLGRIFIAPSHQNLGIGAAALRALEERFPDARKWTLDTPYRNVRNHHFYEKLGYMKVGETEPDAGNGFYLFLYEKQFSR
ncbi:acetyltransferase (GNAT) family protein [Hydrogenispora ethanolica]|uniref:Acetyltransferase (GNAT) family protein n=1 Tax=Hydrogenispora ethanolica TaxID=1082276 RepID=A0A4R1RAR1_HYDET|nr:GNAT family N-acetyltransferase [Hydrogenispora ethanolica]TCL62739.1 acetyltransferase (GNAT) family protein [Hydrogenispora ethanolica]